MAAIEGRVDPVRAWVLAAIAGTVALLGGALAFPRAVYDRFVWHYFWGPVHADAAGARCAVRAGEGVRLLDSANACAAAISRGAIVAEPGYTVVSEIGYAVILLFMLLGVWFMLRRLDLGRDRAFFYALLPFMFFGGALRVVEDANVALTTDSSAEAAISYPLSTIIISPIIYFTVFAITLGAVLGSVRLARTERFDVKEYSRPLLWSGIAVLAATLAVLLALAGGTQPVGFYPQMSVLVLTITTVIAIGIWAAVRRFAPEITYGTAGIGFVILWGHTLDGVANVIASDWARAIGLPFEYSAKHPVNRFIIDATQGLLPPSLAATIGTAWPFLLVKIVAALAVVWLFDETIFEESPRYAILLLIAILAVGLGPGTRDMLRATFGI
jgi:uncharacterized membrane protein